MLFSQHSSDVYSKSKSILIILIKKELKCDCGNRWKCFYFTYMCARTYLKVWKCMRAGKNMSHPILCWFGIVFCQKPVTARFPTATLRKDHTAWIMNRLKSGSCKDVNKSWGSNSNKVKIIVFFKGIIKSLANETLTVTKRDFLKITNL